MCVGFNFIVILYLLVYPTLMSIEQMHGAKVIYDNVL